MVMVIRGRVFGTVEKLLFNFLIDNADLRGEGKFRDIYYKRLYKQVITTSASVRQSCAFATITLASFASPA